MIIDPEASLPDLRRQANWATLALWRAEHPGQLYPDHVYELGLDSDLESVVARLVWASLEIYRLNYLTLRRRVGHMIRYEHPWRGREAQQVEIDK